MAEQQRIRRERIKKLIRDGCTDREIVGRGYGASQVSRFRQELKIKNPGDVLTAKEAREAAKRTGIKPGSRRILFGKKGRPRGEDSRNYYIDRD